MAREVRFTGQASAMVPVGTKDDITEIETVYRISQGDVIRYALEKGLPGAQKHLARRAAAGMGIEPRGAHLTEQITAMIPRGTKEGITQLQERYGVSQGTVIRYALEKGLPAARRHFARQAVAF